MARLPTRRVTLDEDPRDDICCLAFSADGKTLASASSRGPVKLWDVSTGTLKTKLPTGATRLAFSGDGTTLVSASHSSGEPAPDRVVKLWDLATGKQKATWNTRIDWNFALSGDGKLLAAVSNFEMKLWDVAAGKETALKHHRTAMYVALSDDGRLLASAGSRPDEKVKLWDVVLAREQAALTVPAGGIRTVALSRDGKFLASATVHEAMLWDVASGEVKATFKGEKGNATDDMMCVAFSGDGKSLAVGFPNKVILWDVVAGQEKATLTSKNDWVMDVALNADGTLLAAAVFGAYLWEIPSTQKAGQ